MASAGCGMISSAQRSSSDPCCVGGSSRPSGGASSCRATPARSAPQRFAGRHGADRLASPPFEIGGLWYGDGGLLHDEPFDGDAQSFDAGEVCLRDFHFTKGEGPAFFYTYDFGDDWRHTVKLEKLLVRVPIRLIHMMLFSKSMVQRGG
jgi:hypothetical protein